MADIILYVILALLIVHEMDAVSRSEWRMFAGLSRLPDNTGYIVFSALHIPLFAGLFYGLFGAGETAGQIVATVLDIFLVVHVLLHLLFMKHRRNDFVSIFSWAIISGLGALAPVNLIMILMK